MNEKWSEKTAFEKALDIISGIALCVWLIFERIEGATKADYAELGSYISIGVVCVCQAISFWNVKRVFSYVAIAGIICMLAAAVLSVMLLA